MFIAFALPSCYTRLCGQVGYIIYIYIYHHKRKKTPPSHTKYFRSPHLQRVYFKLVVVALAHHIGVCTEECFRKEKEKDILMRKSGLHIKVHTWNSQPIGFLQLRVSIQKLTKNLWGRGRVRYGFTVLIPGFLRVWFKRGRQTDRQMPWLLENSREAKQQE